MRDAIVISGWTWDARNVPERLALALARTGARVLYCENPVSFIRRPSANPSEVAVRVFRFRPVLLSHRLNRQRGLSQLQALLVRNQIMRVARRLELNDPVFFYPHGEYTRTLAAAMKRQGRPLVHICMDYEIQNQMEHVQLSDVTLAIPEAAFSELRERLGAKIRRLPQFAAPSSATPPPALVPVLPRELQPIPRPWLVYFGSIDGRVDLKLLAQVLRNHPEWHFISFGREDCLALPNSHVLPWGPPDYWSPLLSGDAIGFLPYDCLDLKNLYCVPLKLFDYFARGLPVVSTPIAYVRDYPDLVYTGGNADELASAILAALHEPPDSSLKAKRMALAAEHSIENLSRILEPLLGEAAL